MKWAAEFCHYEKKIERFMPYQHEWQNNYIWLCRGKNALFTHTIFVVTRCTDKLLQGVMCRLSIDNMTRPIVKNMPVVAIAFNIPVCCIYIYSCRDSLEVHRYLSVLVE